MRALRFALLSPLPLVLLWELGCSSPKDNALFADDSLTSAAAASAGGTSAAASGTSSISGASQSTAGSSTSAGGSQAGTSSGGFGGGGIGGNEITSGGSGGGEQIKRIESCDMLEGAVTNEQNGHCYRVNSDKLSFTAAREACQAAAGHLVTLGDEAEDDYVHDLLDDAHWIGGSDGRPDRTEGTGPYTWVDGEPWGYSNWEDGQPNAVATNCPNENSGSNCYEHCAFQTADGAWNDRACFHTIASICEWDLEIPPSPGSAGEAGQAR
jgi:Lectin C-type domain